MQQLKKQHQQNYQTGLKQRTALDDLWSLEEKMKNRKVHTSQIAGPSKNNLDSVFDYSSDSTLEEQRKEAIDYDTMHPPSPKISKGGTIKKSKVPKFVESMSKKHDESLIDVHSTASSIDATDRRTSKPEENPAYDSDVPGPLATVNRKEKSNNEDELSSDVDIAPSGIVRKENNDFQCHTINSKSDEGNRQLQENSDVDIANTGT